MKEHTIYPIIKHGILCLIACFLASCGETHVHEVVNRTKTIEIQTEVIVKKVNGNDKYKIIKIDGCEYLSYYELGGFNEGAAGGICHKGNCPNHLNNK